MLEQLRDALKENCIESMRIKIADEIREKLEHVSEVEPERRVTNITKVTIALSQRVVSLISNIYKRLLPFVTEI